MEVLDKILAWIKGIIIDWRIGTVGLVGFTTGLIITKDTNLIIGITVSASMIIVNIIDKNYADWYENYLNKKINKTVSDPKYQQKFFDSRSDEEMKILTQLYRNYPEPCPLSMENAAVDNLTTRYASKIASRQGWISSDIDGNKTTVFNYVLRSWVKKWFDNNKKKLKRSV